MGVRLHCRKYFAVCLALSVGVPVPSALRAAETIADDPIWRARHGLPLEHPDDLPAAAARAAHATQVAEGITFGRFTSIQVNLNSFGQDVIGDAANEPSLATHPRFHNRMVIGWRQFGDVVSNFREAGVAFTLDGGQTWEAGIIDPGIFRSDPVLGTDSVGTFLYNSLTASGSIRTWVFQSFDGETWGPPISAYGGDKQWMTVDRGLHHVYQTWSTASNSYAPNTFDKSLDDADSFAPPSFVPGSPVWGTLAVANDHTLYLAGWDSMTDTFRVARSDDAQTASPSTFTTVPVDLGGAMRIGGPNPAGLLGQVWVAVDRSTGPRAGWVYLLASVEPPGDPLDVMFTRSTDRGQTWSTPVRVNDDPAGNRAFQWFGTLSVAPSGRIDAVWNDTRGSADSTKSAVYYAYSVNGGATWSANEQVTPAWNSTVGWPNQQKIGDYYDMKSDNDGADLAYAATFNGGQDVYYVRIPSTGPLAAGAPPAPARTPLDNVPNPFGAATTIRFDVPLAGTHARLEVFDVRGRRVATLLDGFVRGPGHSVRWDGRGAAGANAPPGVYLCRLQTATGTESRRLLRMK